MKTELEAIRRYLIKHSSNDAKAAFQKFIPTSQRVYGVRVPLLNELAKTHKVGGFPLVEALWNSGAFEERLLAAKILSRVAKKEPERALRLIRSFSRDISDWAVCDTLGMQAVRPLAEKFQKEVFALATALLASKNAWERRFGIVLLTNYAKNAALRPKIKNLVQPLADDREHYVRKAIEWLRRDLSK